MAEEDALDALPLGAATDSAGGDERCLAGAAAAGVAAAGADMECKGFHRSGEGVDNESEADDSTADAPGAKRGGLDKRVGGWRAVKGGRVALRWICCWDGLVAFKGGDSDDDGDEVDFRLLPTMESMSALCVCEKVLFVIGSMCGVMGRREATGERCHESCCSLATAACMADAHSEKAAATSWGGARDRRTERNRSTCWLYCCSAASNVAGVEGDETVGSGWFGRVVERDAGVGLLPASGCDCDCDCDCDCACKCACGEGVQRRSCSMLGGGALFSRSRC